MIHLGSFAADLSVFWPCHLGEVVRSFSSLAKSSLSDASGFISRHGLSLQQQKNPTQLKTGL